MNLDMWNCCGHIGNLITNIVGFSDGGGVLRWIDIDDESLVSIQISQPTYGTASVLSL